ncbi:MAG TPA: adenylate/guanylate cyclase domain-containing protein, partial [Thermoanaerobaculia bacterium]|nr:adenylate/guanylate cyclase domain-containing protein [Thermoanaerobaculia bacterium]
PVVVMFDDVHWAEPAFLDLVEYLVGWSENAPILCVCLGRPELLEARPGWRQRTEREWSATLQPLSPSESDLLLANLLARGKLAEAAKARIVDAAEGNPLFVEEMLRMLVDENLLRQESGQWTSVRDLSDLAVPPTINALIGARIDRLSAGEQSITQRASVVGKVFWWGAVAHMSPAEERSAVGGHLQTLVRKELIQPERSSVEGEDAFRFHHLLIRDTVYQGTPKARRADLHELFAEWLERVVGERLAEYEEVVGYHLEQAARYLTELEPGTARAMDLAARAASRLAPAGRRAFAHGDMGGAANLLGRARALLPAEDALRRELLPDLAEALSEEGELGPAASILDEAVARAAEAGDARTEAHATIVRMLLAESTEPEGRSDVALKELERIIPIFEQLADDLGLARSYRLVGDVYWTRAQYANCNAALLQGLDHARRAGAVREETECLGQLSGAYLYGPTHVDEVIRRCDGILEDPGARPAAEARALRTLASCRAMQGRFDEARDLVGRSRRMLNELGLHLRAAFTSEAAGFVEMLAGDAAAAEAEFRSGFETAEEFGELGYRATAAGLLSQALFAQERLDEADALAGTAEEATAADDLTTQILWRGVRGRVLSVRGEHADAEALAREAASLAAETDDVNMRADTLVDLAHVLRAAGRDAEADGEVGRALDLYEEKGNAVAAARTRTLRASWAGAVTP